MPTSLNRISKEKSLNDKNRMLFYAAEYYDMFQNKSIALKFYVEVSSVSRLRASSSTA